MDQLLSASATRVRDATLDDINQEIDQKTIDDLTAFAQCPEMIDRRLRELDREWDIERTLEANAAALSVIGIFKSMRSRLWILLPLTVVSFLLQHALQGWCPPVPFFRRLGIRTRREIENERTALKLIRGDFDELAGQDNPDARRVFDEVRQPMTEE